MLNRQLTGSVFAELAVVSVINGREPELGIEANWYDEFRYRLLVLLYNPKLTPWFAISGGILKFRVVIKVLGACRI